MKRCCVADCTGENDDTVFFEFPTSRGLRRKWLEMIKLPSKFPPGTVVCSQHFNTSDYEVVRGKVRLNRRSVPTLKLYHKKPQVLEHEQESPIKDKELPAEKNTVQSSNNSTNDNTVDVPTTGDTGDLSKTGNTGDITESTLSPEEVKKESTEDNKDIDNKDGADIHKVVNKDEEGVIISENDRLPPIPDPKQPPDFEDMITNYQIKNSKPHSLLPLGSEIEVPIMPEVQNIPLPPGEAIVLDDKEDTAPVFIEIPVDKDSNLRTSANADCLMVLESVQVEVDPTSLLAQIADDPNYTLPHPEAQFDEHPLSKKENPISLLTSSDEDDVIIQEPHIDIVEVSDETDEDDMPLVKLLKKKTKKRKLTKNRFANKLPATPEELRKLVWTAAYDFYCMECHFTTTDSLEYNTHVHQHQKVLQVCHICNYTSASKTQFTRHIRKHNEEKKYKCHYCEYRARHNMSLIYHLQCHERDRDKIKCVKNGFKCKKCGFKSQAKNLALQHVRVCDSVRKFSCNLCSYVTKRKSDLKRHRSSRHSTVVEVASDCSFDPEWH